MEKLTAYEKKWGKGPHVAVDGVITKGKMILLVFRKKQFCWALPGGFVEPGEWLKDAVAREVREETGVYIHQGVFKDSHTFDYPRRDKRGHIISMAFHYSFQPYGEIIPKVQDTEEIQWAQWWSILKLPDDMFADHREIIQHFVLKV